MSNNNGHVLMLDPGDVPGKTWQQAGCYSAGFLHEQKPQENTSNPQKIKSHDAHYDFSHTPDTRDERRSFAKMETGKIKRETRVQSHTTQL